MDTSLAPSQGLDFYASGLASGKKDIYEAILGPPPREAKQSAVAKKWNSRFVMPENYVGETLDGLRDTVEDYMLTAAWDFWTERILPWYRTDQIHMQWTEWENSPHYMGITPHLAPSRVVTQRRTIRKASIIRRGIAAEFELDFVTTPLGRSSFDASLAQISRSIQETGNVEVLRALLGCHRNQQGYIRKFGIVADGDLDSFLQRKAERFMAAQKNMNGLEILATQVEQDQEQYQGKGNVWILGREVADYCRFRPEKSLYYLGGQEAIDNVNNRSRGRLAAGNTNGNVRSLEPPGMIGDTPVYFAKSHHVDTVGKAELLSRTVEVGVYNMMIDRTRDYSNYRSEGRNLRVYDNDIDNWSDIELITAIEGCGIWKKDGTLAEIYNVRRNRGGHAHSVKDQEHDFLSYVDASGARVNIKFIGDMSSRVLTSINLQNAGQTLLNAISNMDSDDAREINRLLNLTTINKATSAADLRILFAPAVNKLGSLLGEKNQWFQDDGLGIDAFIQNFVTPHLVHAVQGAAPSVGASAGAATGGDAKAAAENKFLSEIIGAPLPASHHDQLQQIVGQSAKDWTLRAQEIKNLVLTVQKENPDAITALKTATDVDKWHNKQVKEFQSKMEKKYGSAVGAAAGAAAAAGEVHYFPAGAAIPAGWTVIQSPATSSLESRMPAFRAPAAAQSAAAGQRRGLIGSHLVSGAPGARGEYSQKDRAADVAADKVPRGAKINLKEHVAALEKSSASRAIKTLGALYAGCEFTRERLVEFARNHIYVPIGFLLMRPHATYKTRFGIKVAAGGDTGYTFFGHSDMRLETEAVRKSGVMHYTTYMSAVVMRPKNVYVVEDLFCQKYLGGMGVEFWSPEEYQNTQNRKSRSILCAPLPPNFKKIEQKIDIRGRWYTEQRLGLVTAERFDRPLYPGCGRMDALFGMSDKANKQAGGRGVAMNFVCWQGMEWYFNTKSQQFDDFTVESGNFGPKVYPGCGAVRNGQAMYLEDPGYKMRVR